MAIPRFRVAAQIAHHGDYALQIVVETRRAASAFGDIRRLDRIVTDIEAKRLAITGGGGQRGSLDRLFDQLVADRLVLIPTH